ncbi:MAG: DUF885 domain-containing protein [Bacteroidetes bacterium]|nr:DUF885 domain-containing protein [Bacteroidota bacterium]
MRNLLLLVMLLLVGCSPSEKKDGHATTQLQTFLDGFLGSSPRGRRQPDDSLSKESFDRSLAKTQAQLVQLRAIDTSQLKGDDLIDWKFAQSILVGREVEQAKIQAWKRDPRLFMTFTGISDVINQPIDVSKKIAQVKKRLAIAPTQLENGMKLLDTYVPRFQELGLFMAENGYALFDKEIPAFAQLAGADGDTILHLSKAARLSLERYIHFIKDELPKKEKGDFAIGYDTYNQMLKGQYLISYSSDSLYEYGWKMFNQTVSELEQLAKEIDPSKTWQQLALEIKSDGPAPEKMIEAHQEWVDKAGEHIRSHDLISIPWNERVRVVPRAEYLRKTSYYGNFSSAKSKDQDSIYTSEWMINPYEEQWDAKRKQEYLTEHDWGVIIVTAPHETYGGHHVQGLYQLHHSRKLRRTNGISFFSEGWGLYNEQLMQETGFFPNERIHLRQLQLRLWRNARVIYDVGMHTGKLTYEDAIQLMTDKVGFLRWAAQLEVDSSTASPGYFIGYFTGMMEILKMREQFKLKRGTQFTLKDFHDRLLKIGNMPPSLMSEALFNDLK